MKISNLKVWLDTKTLRPIMKADIEMDMATTVADPHPTGLRTLGDQFIVELQKAIDELSVSKGN